MVLLTADPSHNSHPEGADEPPYIVIVSTGHMLVSVGEDSVPEKVAEAPDSEPETVREPSVPTLVMLGWAAVKRVPVTPEVAVSAPAERLVPLAAAKKRVDVEVSVGAEMLFVQLKVSSVRPETAKVAFTETELNVVPSDPAIVGMVAFR